MNGVSKTSRNISIVNRSSKKSNSLLVIVQVPNSLFITYLRHNIINWFNDIVQIVTSVQTLRLGVTLALNVLLHHLVVEEPNAFRHVAKVASFAPDAEIENQIHDAARHCRGCRHGGIHLGKMGADSHSTAPFHVIGKDLGVKSMDRARGLDRRRQDVAAHVSTVVAKKNEQVLGLVADRGILETEKISQIFTRRIDHIGVFCEARWEVSRVEHIECIGRCIPSGQKVVAGLAFRRSIFTAVGCLRHRRVAIGGGRTECLGNAQATKASVTVGDQASHQK